MSTGWITLIPIDPGHIPPIAAQEEALEQLKAFVPDAREVRASASDRIDFHTGNGNWSGVLCPFCETDIEEWFFGKVEERYADAWKDLNVVTPCCNAPVSLNDMSFVWPAGFARFALEARDPNVYDLEPVQLQALEETLGCKLRRIWVHI